MNYQILQGDNRETLKTIPDNSIDAIVTDPPYGIDFLGKAWDANTGALETYQECLRVLKPGGHILAFSAARTYHHLAVTLESAGFEIRDQIMWIYSSGFPKSQDVGKSIDRAAKKASKTIKNGTKKSRGEKIEGFDLGSGTRCPECKRDSNARYSCDKGQDCGMVYKPQTKEAEQWEGWGTALKPAHEPIALARKPLKQSIAKNCQEWGVGALNIDATRVKADDLQKIADWYSKDPTRAGTTGTFNNILSEAQDKERVDRVDAISDSTKAQEDILKGRFPSNVLGEIPDYQKYFYCPKVSRSERHIGYPKAKGMYEIAREHGYTLAYDDPNDTSVGYMVDTLGNKVPDLVLQKLVEQHGGGNNHPTVKPIELMKYLIKLVTPPGGTVLDPFNGSGSTGCAAVELGHPYIGCELDPKYVDIAHKRIQAWYAQCNPNTFRALFTQE